MASLTITMPAADATRVVAAFRGLYDVPEGQSDIDCAKEQFIQFAFRTVERWERKQAHDAVVPGPDPDIT